MWLIFTPNRWHGSPSDACAARSENSVLLSGTGLENVTTKSPRVMTTVRSVVAVQVPANGRHDGVGVEEKLELDST